MNLSHQPTGPTFMIWPFFIISDVLKVTGKRLYAVGPSSGPELESEHPVAQLLAALPVYIKPVLV